MGTRSFSFRVNNCLFSYGEFNLLSVSQLNLVNGNGVDFSRHLSCMILHSGCKWRREIRIPLVLDDGLYGIQMEPLQTDDPRYYQCPKCDVTPKGEFMMSEDYQLDGWRKKVLAFASPSATILTAPDRGFAANLESICEGFLPPPSIPTRKQYELSSGSDMSELSIRFMGSGSDCLRHTIGISQGLASPVTKTFVKTS
jgi:hypothetical protein